MTKWIYKFHEGSTAMRNLPGGKGYNLAKITNLGMPISQGFTVITEACTEYYNCDKQIPQEIQNQVLEATTWLEDANDKKSDDTEDPLLVSVRSGVHASMPGIMDTILNLGLNDVAVEGFVKKTGNPRLAYDSYRRLIQTYPDVVMEVLKSCFEKIIDKMKEAEGVYFDTDLTASDLKELTAKFKAVYRDTVNGEEFPQNPIEQLMGAVGAVFCSWDNPRAIVYRRVNDIPGDWGIAANVQIMVFGNKGEISDTGVASTRNPSTDTRGIYDEYLINAQGEGVVAGVHTPRPISKLAEDLPECYEELMGLIIKLENHSHDMQDMELIIEGGKLYFPQTHNGKGTAPAAIQIACDLADEGMTTPREAVCRIETKSLDQLLHPAFVLEALKAGEVIGSAFPASPDATAGRVYFTANKIKDAGKDDRGERVTLVRLEISPEDIEGMHAAQDVLTVRDGMTNHATAIAHGTGTCCVFDCGEIKVDKEARVFELGGHIFHEGDYTSLDGSTGEVYEDDIATQEATVSGNFGCVMEWTDQFRALRVRTDAGISADTLDTVKLGAEGIGLCCIEHMFFDTERVPKIHKMTLSETVEQREETSNELIPLQKGDSKAIYKAPEERPMAVCYLDPPLYESVPTDPEGVEALANNMGTTVEVVNAKCTKLHGFSPMMSHHGRRLAVTYPEIAKMQTRAVMEATIEVEEECGYDIIPEITAPLVDEKREPKYVKGVMAEIVELAKKGKNSGIQYHIGTMIEVPRAALTVDKVVEKADFFSFGTNGLTQIAFDFSRDDAGKSLDFCYKVKIYESDPFVRLDQEGIGQLIKVAVKRGRPTKADLKCGIYGKYGGDPLSVEFYHRTGPNYVSCSPFRVPTTCLAATQAAPNNK